MTVNARRRRLFVGSASALALGLAGRAGAQQKVTLLYSDIVPESDPRTQILRQVFAGGLGPDFEFKSYHGGTLYKQGTEPQAIQRGNLDMANIASADVVNQLPVFSILMTPYLIKDVAHLRRIWASDIGSELNAMLEQKVGLRILANPYIGTRHLNLKPKRRIMRPADLAGIKLRMPPGEAWQFVGTALGANPTPLAFTEVYTALQTGAIDAQDNALPANKNMKFYEVTSQIVLTGHLVAANHFVIGVKKWRALTDAQRQRVQEAAAKFEQAITDMALKEEQELVGFFKQHGLDVYTPDVAAFRAHVLDLYRKSKFAKDWPAGLFDRIANA